MCSTYIEGKFVVAERFIRNLKNKFYNHMTYVSKNVYINKLDDIVNEYNNIYQRTIKIKPVEVKDNTYIDSIKESNDKDPKSYDLNHNTKTYLLKDILQIGLKKFL